jgi:enamine deaminase RidA (YjgF/YER057c/UK114 family)
MKNTLLLTALCSASVTLFGCGNCQHEHAAANTPQRRIINPWTWQDTYGFVQGNEVEGAQRLFFTAGIVSVDGDGNLLHADSMEGQINQILDNMETLLAQGGYELSDVVRFTYYTTDVQAFGRASAVLTERLSEANCRPATSLIGVASLFHPECLVEIEATAAK